MNAFFNTEKLCKTFLLSFVYDLQKAFVRYLQQGSVFLTS